jgi:signal transduction histidine kinase
MGATGSNLNPSAFRGEGGKAVSHRASLGATPDPGAGATPDPGAGATPDPGASLGATPDPEASPGAAPGAGSASHPGEVGTNAKAASVAGLGAEDYPDGLVIADETAQVIAFNSIAARITGAEADEVLGKHIAEALPLEDFEGRQWWECTDPYGGLATRTRQPEHSLLLPGGREVLVAARFVRARPCGPVRRLVVTLRGTEARARSERRQANLVATVAHELRSPLTSVKGFTATLLAKWERFSDEQKRLMMETVNADADRVTRLITELLDISRIDSGRLEIRRQVVDVAASVQRLVAGLVAGGEPEGRFAVDVRGPLPEMWLDSDKLDQILANLVENAVHHGSGTVSIVVEPDGTSDQQGAAVTVSDEGQGIPEELVSRVFTRFWRGSRRGGTGLGLYIVKGLVEAHGGTIAVGRSRSGGAEFRFTLPAGTPDFAA